MRYAFDGQLVEAPVKGRWIRCVVACACGYTVRVVNELHGVDTWRHVDELRAVPDEKKEKETHGR